MPRKETCVMLVGSKNLAFGGSTYPSKKENALLPHPEPSVKCVNTYSALCLFGVKTSKAMQIENDARTLSRGKNTFHKFQEEINLLFIGANHIIIL
jgi:hypothetical protein